MLCPEVWNFPPPKVRTNLIENDSLDTVLQQIKMNNFYRSLIVTLPDEMSLPSFIEESLLEDTEYYEISDIPLSKLVETVFIENFIKNGTLYCLTVDRNCMIDNCACITPDGILTLHVIDYVFQTLGLEGTKRPHNFYEVSIDLKQLKNPEKTAAALDKLEHFKLNVSWVPNNETVCPSSIAKYFSDMEFNVRVCAFQTSRMSPEIEEVPSLKGADLDEMVEWIGMLSIGGDLQQTETYISTYCTPESDNPMKTNRISILIIKGFITPNIITALCKKLPDYVTLREIEEYWTSVSVQSYEHSLWQWTTSAPRMFTAQDSSSTLFITQNKCSYYSVGQIIYS